MKNLITNLFLLLVLVFAFSSCEKEDSLGIASGIQDFPQISLLGDQLMIVEFGTNYEDPGAVAILGEEDLTDQILVDGDVDDTEPGVYFVEYSVSIITALETEETVSEIRTVLIATPEALSDDLSGDYFYFDNPSWPIAEVNFVAPGIYSLVNFVGRGFNVSPPMSIYRVTETELQIPLQPSNFGRYFGTDGRVTDFGIQYTINLLDPPNSGLVLDIPLYRQ